MKCPETTLRITKSTLTNAEIRSHKKGKAEIKDT